MVKPLELIFCYYGGREVDELKNELLAYEILYLDKEERENEMKEVLENVLKRTEGKETVFFVALKTSPKCQADIFNMILNGEYSSKLTREEMFSLMYFLTYTTQRNLSFREGSWNLRGTTKNDCPLACSAE